VQPVPGGEVIEVQLLHALLDLLAQIDTQFQVWLTVTFAVLVASFIAGKRLSIAGRVTIAVLYGAAGAVVILRYATAIQWVAYVRALYETYGIAPPPESGTVVAIRLVLMMLGGLVTGLAVLFPGLGFRAHPTEPDA
jgi:hypothetical protein